MTLSPFFARGVVLAGVVLALDQALKWWILEVVMQPPRVIEITSFFNLVMTWNRGISFGLFNTDSPWNALILSIVAVVISAALTVWMARADSRTLAVGLGLIIGGAIGNLVDRVRFGAVADFLDLHAWGWHWPAFNIADAAITIGVTILIADSLFGRAEDRKTEATIGRDAGE